MVLMVGTGENLQGLGTEGEKLVGRRGWEIFMGQLRAHYPPPQVIKNNLNPTWKRFSVPLQHFCGGDLGTPIQVRSQL